MLNMSYIQETASMASIKTGIRGETASMALANIKNLVDMLFLTYHLISEF